MQSPWRRMWEVYSKCQYVYSARCEQNGSLSTEQTWTLFSFFYIYCFIFDFPLTVHCQFFPSFQTPQFVPWCVQRKEPQDFSCTVPSLSALCCGILLHFTLARVSKKVWQYWTLEARWIACCHKSRCQLAAKLTADLWCVWAREGTVWSKRGHCVEQERALCGAREGTVWSLEPEVSRRGKENSVDCK